MSTVCTKSELSGSDNDNGNYNNVPCLKGGEILYQLNDMALIKIQD